MTIINRPAPVGGWNARDAEASMGIDDAVEMVNIIPRSGHCETRRGYTEFADLNLGGSNSIGTIQAFIADTSEWLIAFTDEDIYSIDINGSVGGEVSPLASNNQWWNTTQFNNTLIACNGVDNPVYLQPSGTALSSNFLSVTGVTASDLWGCFTYKGRVYYWKEDEASFWYADVGAFQGALTEFPLDRVAYKGGRLLLMVNLTIDGGAGVDDLAVFIMSTGQCLVYQGSDPGTANDWQLVGVFQIGQPLGPRGYAQVGGTTIVATMDGWVDLSQALTEARFGEKAAFSHKINRAAKNAASSNKNYDGWQVFNYPEGDLFIINIPTSSDAATSEQHVRTTDTGGWCRFEGLDATNFAVFNGNLFFGTKDGILMRADIGDNDNGSAIEAYVIPAYVNTGKSSRLTGVRHISDYEFSSFVAIEGHADFNTTFETTVSVAVGPSVEALRVKRPLRGVKKSGTWLTASFRVKTKLQTTKFYGMEMYID